MAAALLRVHLDVSGVDARVRSAGTMAWEAPATADAVEVMRELGLDISDHRSTPLGERIIDESDLILGMTRDHLGRVASLAPDAVDRAFLVGELVRLGDKVGPRGVDEDLRVWLHRLSAARPHRRMLGRSRDEVPDPLGEPIERYRSTAARLDDELGEVARLLTT